MEGADALSFKDEQIEILARNFGLILWAQLAVYSIAVQCEWVFWNLDVEMSPLQSFTSKRIGNRSGVRVRSLQYELLTSETFLVRTAKHMLDESQLAAAAINAKFSL